jgi:hypothetical protein
MKTICTQCKHLRRWSVKNGRAYHHGTRCFAPWPKELDPVTGEKTPLYESCEEKNDGVCPQWRQKPPRLIVRFWNCIIDGIFFSEGMRR